MYGSRVRSFSDLLSRWTFYKGFNELMHSRGHTFWVQDSAWCSHRGHLFLSCFQPMTRSFMEDFRSGTLLPLTEAHSWGISARGLHQPEQDLLRAALQAAKGSCPPSLLPPLYLRVSDPHRSWKALSFGSSSSSALSSMLFSPDPSLPVWIQFCWLIPRGLSK